MSLSSYKQKRSPKETPEPFGGKPVAAALKFVVQKHAASHLHYDFRMEMDGVLKSWAIPKGPSTDPAVKRLAMMVEDHPYDYRDFEGIIPEGQYGGGTVIVWDEGTYEPIEVIKGKKAQEKDLIDQLEAGSVKIVLHGKKLKGEFALVKTKGMGENAWLLIKHKDKYARETDITLKDKSVLSKKTIEQVARNSHNIWGKEAVKEEKKTTISAPKKKAIHPLKKRTLKNTGKQRFYDTVTPMLATLVNKPPEEDQQWVYEVKWDGYRAVAFMNKGKISLKSRNDNSFNDKFYPHT